MYVNMRPAQVHCFCLIQKNILNSSTYTHAQHLIYTLALIHTPIFLFQTKPFLSFKSYSRHIYAWFYSHTKMHIQCSLNAIENSHEYIQSWTQISMYVHIYICQHYRQELKQSFVNEIVFDRFCPLQSNVL